MLRSLLLAVLAALPCSGFCQTSFDVASIRPATERVPNERDGRTTISRDVLQMHDVTVRNCVAFAYGVSTSQVAGPASITDKRYDIVAKVDHDVSPDQMRRDASLRMTAVGVGVLGIKSLEDDSKSSGNGTRAS